MRNDFTLWFEALMSEFNVNTHTEMLFASNGMHISLQQLLLAGQQLLDVHL